MDREITITVSDHEARIIDERVRSGAFDSPDAVVRAALENLAVTEANQREESRLLRRLIEEARADEAADVPSTEALAEVRQHVRRRTTGGPA